MSLIRGVRREDVREEPVVRRWAVNAVWAAAAEEEMEGEEEGWGRGWEGGEVEIKVDGDVDVGGGF